MKEVVPIVPTEVCSGAKDEAVLCNEKDKFENIIGPFLTEKLGGLIDEMYDFVTCYKTENHSFVRKHRECFWFMNVVRRVFLTYTRPSLDNIFGHSVREQIECIVHHSQRAITRELIEKLYAETAGIDIEFIIALAGETYESKENDDLSIVILPYRNHPSFNREGAIKFLDSACLELNHENVHAIRKQLNLAQGRVLAVAKCRKKGKYYTSGILPSDALFQYPSFKFEKGLTWNFSVPSSLNRSSCILRYRRGSFVLPFMDLQAEMEELILTKIKRFSRLHAAEISKTISSIAISSQCTKGSVLIFGDRDFITAECKRLVKDCHRGILLSPAISLTDKTCAKTVTQLSNIDGALLVDVFGKCHACGVILDGEASESGDPGRGARYNSTISYVETCSKKQRDKIILGVVKSEDGMLDCFPK